MESIIFLENYVEGTNGMPPDLQRIVNLIKALDDKAADLQHTIQQLAEQCIARHPQYLPSSRSSPANPTGDAEDVASIRARIEEQQRLLILYVEEKVALASQAQDLMQHHLQRLNHDMRECEEELRAYAAAANYDYGYEDMPSKRFGMGSRTTSRLLSDFDFGGAPATGGRRIEDSTQRRGSRLNAEFEMVPNSTPVADGGGRRSAVQKKENAPYSGTGYANLATPTYTASRKKANQRGSRGAEAAAAAASFPMEAAPVVPVPLAPIPGLDGLETSATQPQAPGTLLREADVNQSLIGRRAELYWPDDNLWYIIEIQSVDMVTRKAQILYITGESEELDLNEIIKEGHMSLITMNT